MGITAVGIAVARGDAAAARSAAARLWAELEQVADRPDLLARWCAVAQAQARLISGDPAGAIASVSRTLPTTPGSPPRWNGSCWPRPTWRLGRPPPAGRHCSPRCWNRTCRILAPAVEARVLLAVAADRQHRDTAALAAMTEAIDLAQPEGLLAAVPGRRAAAAR